MRRCVSIAKKMKVYKIRVIRLCSVVYFLGFSVQMSKRVVQIYKGVVYVEKK